jgi:hypothetical protein
MKLLNAGDKNYNYMLNNGSWEELGVRLPSCTLGSCIFFQM